MKFSERYGYVPSKAIQIEKIDDALKNRLINAIKENIAATSNPQSLIEYILDKFGYIVGNNYSDAINFSNIIGNENTDWYNVYDIIELIIEYQKGHITYQDDERNIDAFTYISNKILEEEKSGYRIVNEKVVQITNSTEIGAIEQASSTEFETVNTHINKALQLYADRQKPDYENSIKESISAVESMCCIITGLTGSQATLGNAIKKLKDSGVIIHFAMEKAFGNLYGYTSDEDGIRHGGIDFKNAPEEDAKFMLVSCSAFVNYLIVKYSKVKGN